MREAPAISAISFISARNAGQHNIPQDIDFLCPAEMAEIAEISQRADKRYLYVIDYSKDTIFQDIVCIEINKDTDL